jgi:hypothetical protein
LAAEKKYWDLYGETYALCRKFQLKNGVGTSVNKFNKAELATLEYLYFITAATPQIAYKEQMRVREKSLRIFKKELQLREITEEKARKIAEEKIEKWGKWEGDSDSDGIKCKYEINLFLYDEDTSKIAERLSVEKLALDKLHCTYFAAILNSYFVEREETLEEDQKDMGAAYCPPLGSHFFMSEIEKIEVYPKLISLGNIYQESADVQEVRNNMILGATQRLEREGAQFVEKLIQSFPQNGPLIREYIKKAGFSSDFACAQLLQQTLDRNAETACLFNGLPNQKKVAQMEAERIKKDEIKEKILKLKREKAQKKERKEIENLLKILDIEIEKIIKEKSK